MFALKNIALILAVSASASAWHFPGHRTLASLKEIDLTTSKLTEAILHWKDDSESGGHEASEIKETLMDQMKQLRIDVLDRDQAKSKDSLDVVEYLFTNLGQGVHQGIGIAMEKMAKSSHDVKESLRDGIKDLEDEAEELGKALVEKAADDQRKDMEKAMDAIHSYFEDALDHH